MDDIEDELRWEEWMQLSDEQTEAICDRHMKRYVDWVSSMTPTQWYRYQRRSALRSLREGRKFLADPALHRIECIDQMQRERIKANRLRLLKLRIFRSTGTYPGSA